LFAVSPLGEVRWAAASPFGLPELGGDSVYVADDRVLVAYSTSGERLWEYAAPTRFRTAPVSGGGDTVYIVEQPSILHAVRQGTKAWTYVADGTSGDLTVARDGELYLTAGEKLYCISPDGRRRWLVALRGAEGKPAPGPDGTVYVATAQGLLYAVTPPLEAP
jgi:outer membrane protein assembly factor BamB